MMSKGISDGDDGSRELPRRMGNTMSDAIALSSPGGRISAVAKARAMKRLSVELFGPQGLKKAAVKQPAKKVRLLRQAAELRSLASRGMKPMAYRKRADELERQAAYL